jgi:hypothetical protein
LPPPHETITIRETMEAERPVRRSGVSRENTVGLAPSRA